jgi:hypothetical protein
MRIEGQLQRLIGEGAAALFRDACRLADDGFGLESQATLVWHCAREIESAIRKALKPVAPFDAVANAERRNAALSEAIIRELGLSDADAAIAWWTKVELHGLAHRANLGPPRPFTPADWQTYLTALELILAAFEARYVRMIERLDALLAMTPAAAGAETKKLLCSVPPTGQANALRHFFERADARWLRDLPDCILDDPPGREFAIDQPGWFKWPRWHAARYLAKVAPDEPARVYAKVMKVLEGRPENPSIHTDLIQAAAHFPAPNMASWAMEEAAWLRAQAGLFMGVSRDFAKATEMLVSAGLVDEAFAVGEAVVGLGETPSQRRREPFLRANEHEYGKALEVIAGALTKADARRAAAYLVDVVELAEAQVYPETRDRWSSIWRTSIADDGTNDADETLNRLADALRDALEAAATDQQAVEGLHELLVSGASKSSLLHRFAIHVATVGREFAPALARAAASDPATYTSDTWLEAHRLIEAIGPGLDADGIDNAIAAIRASGIVESKQDELVGVLDGLRAGATPAPVVGEPMFRGYPWVPPPSPVSVERLARWSVPRTVRYLTQWQAAGHRDGDMLEFAFLEVVKANPSRWSRAGTKVVGLSPDFLLRYFSGLREAAKDGATLNGEALARLLEAGLVTGRSWLDPGYEDVRKSAAWLVRDCLSADRLRLTSTASRDALWAVVGALLTDPSPVSVTTSGRSDSEELALAAMNHTRSISTSLIVVYARWLNRQRPGTRRLPPAARLLLEDRLGPTETSTAVRFVIGEQLVALRWLDPAWTESALPRILPRDEDLAVLRDAAWRGFLWHQTVPLDLLRILVPEYRHAIERLDPDGPSTKSGEHLAAHVLMLARIGTIGPDSEDGLLPSLFGHASGDLSRDAIHHEGWQLYNARDEPADEAEIARLRVLWDWLDAEVEAGRANPAALEPFGWWFASGRFDQEWSLGELDRLARANIEIDYMGLVFERLRALAPGDPARIGQVTESIVAYEVRPDEMHGDDLPAIVRILVEDASGPEANRSGKAIISMMVSRAFSNFPEND